MPIKSAMPVAFLSLSILLVSACGGSGGASNPPGSLSSSSSSAQSSSSSSSSDASSGSIRIDPDVEHQTLAGFGGAVPMWNVVTTSLSNAEVRTLVGMGDSELGFSILRTIVDPSPDDWHRAADSLSEAKTYASDVKILASPWSPPAYMKSNQSTNNGGKLLVEHYADYANHLNAYIDYMLTQGVEIDVMSIQNEPDYSPDYQSAVWSGEEIRNFVRDYGDQIQAELMIGESLRFDRNYTDPSLNDSLALENFDMVGGHLYSAESSGTFAPYPLAEEKGKERWMTEWNYHQADGDGAAIWGGDSLAVWDETLDVVLASVHKSMEVNWNAYIWWWSLRFYSFLGDGDSQYGTERGAVLKRGWAFSHYSKFVRPGFKRVEAEADEDLDLVYVTAYKGSENTLVLVILNRSVEDYQSVSITLPLSINSVEGYITSQQSDRAAFDVDLDSQGLSMPTLDARSIVTLVLSY